jgi:hypothetical protein
MHKYLLLLATLAPGLLAQLSTIQGPIKDTKDPINKNFQWLLNNKAGLGKCPSGYVAVEIAATGPKCLSLGSGLGLDGTSILNTDRGSLSRAAHEQTYNHAGYNAHVTSQANPHGVTKSQVGLGNVPNVDATNASNITSGTLPAAQLPASVVQKDANGSIAIGANVPAGAPAGTVAASVIYSPNGALNVKAYGAKGDGTSDDAAALQAWIDDLSGKCGYIPKATYSFATTLTITQDNTCIEAEPGTVLMYTGTATGIQVAKSLSAGDFIANVKLSGFKLQVQPATATALYVWHSANSLFSNLFVTGMDSTVATGKIGIRASGTTHTEFRQIDITGYGSTNDPTKYATYGMIVSDGYLNSPTTTLVLERMYVHYCLRGLDIQPDSNLTVRTSVFESNTNFGVTISLAYVEFFNNWWENNKVSVYADGASTLLEFRGGRMDAYTNKYLVQFHDNTMRAAFSGVWFASSHASPVIVETDGNSPKLTFEECTYPAGSVIYDMGTPAVRKVQNSAVDPSYGNLPVISTGTAAPSANCVAGKELYVDTTGKQMYICSTTNTWELLFKSTTAVPYLTLTGGSGGSGIEMPGTAWGNKARIRSDAGNATVTSTIIEGKLSGDSYSNLAYFDRNTSEFPGTIRSIGKTFANLGAPVNGLWVWCSDCAVGTTCVGSGSGAFAFRSGGAWHCPF